MKTKPTEAYIIAKRLFDYEDEPILESDICEIADIAFQGGQSNPKIKQLEWERHGPIYYVNQYNPIGYTAGITKWAFGENQYSVRLGLNDSNSSVKVFNSLDEAKDFAQKDFEIRIKECLTTE